MIDRRIFGSLFFSRLAPPAMALVAAAGCGTKVPAPPTTQPVHGKVMLNGEAVTTGGFVRFVPVEGGGGRFAEGMIAEDGSYSVSAFKGQAGTLPGEYKVYFSAVQNASEGEVGKVPRLKLPTKYLNAKTTDLTATVASGDNDINLDLQGEVEEEPEEESEEAGEEMSSE